MKFSNYPAYDGKLEHSTHITMHSEIITETIIVNCFRHLNSFTMKNTIHISIAKPCSEKWENFAATSTGGFCASCNKSVVDFTNMSDEEILQYALTMPANSCGRFRNQQLKEYTELDKIGIRPSYTLLKAGLLSLAFLLINKSGYALFRPVTIPSEMIQSISNSAVAEKPLPADQVVRGVVVTAEDGLPLPGVNVLLMGSNIGTVTDQDGKFEFPKRLKEGDVLLFSFIGFSTIEYKVPRHANDALTIELRMDMIMTLGEIAVGKVYVVQNDRQTLWSKFKKLF